MCLVPRILRGQQVLQSPKLSAPPIAIADRQRSTIATNHRHFDRKNSCRNLLSRKLLWIFSSNLPGNFALKNGGAFWGIFSGLNFPRNEAPKLKNLGKFRSNIRGTTIRKIRGTFVLQLFRPKNQKTFRYLWRFCSLLFRGFSVAFSWPSCLEKQFSCLFRGFFVAFSWLFRGPRFGQNLRVLALEQSSDLKSSCRKSCCLVSNRHSIAVADFGVLIADRSPSGAPRGPNDQKL